LGVGLTTPPQIKNTVTKSKEVKNRTDLPRMTLQRTKGLERWLKGCVIVISIRCPEDAIITTSLTYDGLYSHTRNKMDR
jgi:hypothetical protein